MPFASRALRLLLVAVLLFSQQQAVLHLLGHDLSRLTQKESTDPQEPLCAKCLAIAHLDHAVAGDVPTLPVVPRRHARVAVAVPASFDPSFIARYRSRAPPVLS